ncbi:MAG: TadE family protein [Pacificibacter sp.]
MQQHFGPRLIDDRRGAVLVEALLVLPILTILTFGILEMGQLMWQRQQLQVGVRDAARYWSRCRTSVAMCNDRARNIAFYGTPETGTALRVPGWNTELQLTISPNTLPNPPQRSDIVRVHGEVQYLGSPMFDAIFDSGITIQYSYTTRYIGW